MFKATKEQIDAWKKEHGEIFRIVIASANKACYLKKPDRKTLGFAGVAAKENPMKFPETILKNCWLGGDEEIKTDDDLFLSIVPDLEKLNEIKATELEKL